MPKAYDLLNSAADFNSNDCLFVFVPCERVNVGFDLTLVSVTDDSIMNF